MHSYTTGPLGAISVPYNNAYIKEGLLYVRNTDIPLISG